MSEFYYVRTRGEGAFIRGDQHFTREWQKVPAAEVREFEELEIVTEEEYQKRQKAKGKRQEATGPTGATGASTDVGTAGAQAEREEGG